MVVSLPRGNDAPASSEGIRQPNPAIPCAIPPSLVLSVKKQLTEQENDASGIRPRAQSILSNSENTVL